MRTLKYSTKRKIHGFIFILPWIIGFIMFFAIPVFNTVLYSFNDVRVAEQGGMSLTFLGWQNYYDLFYKQLSAGGEQILRILVEENQSMLFDLPLTVIFSLFMALIINANFKGRAVVRLIFFLPIVLGLDVVSNMMSMANGMAQQGASTAAFETVSMSHMILSLSGLNSNPEIAVFISNAINDIFSLISRSGVQTLIFLAGLQSINPSLYEVASIEGATPYETFWKVTIPCTANITFFVAIYSLIDLFLTSPITKEIYNFAFTKSKIGIGSALSVIFMLNAIVFLIFVSWFLKKVVKLDYGK